MIKVMEGVRVLELAQFTFVPAAGAILADWGADVIKVEHPVRGDTQRGFINMGGFELNPQRHPLIEHPNRGPRAPGGCRARRRVRKEALMVTYVTLFHWTEQGISKVQDTIKRAEDFAASAEKAGARVKSFYWTVGQYDGIITVEAPDDATAVALIAKVARLGNIRTETLRAFDSAEMRGVLSKANGKTTR